MKNTLIISDTHFPYHHKDTFDFLEQAAYVYDCQLIKHTGDLVDNHSGSFHDIEYGVLSAMEEHEQAYDAVQRLNKLFPKMVVVKGNHDMIPERKAKAAGIPQAALQTMNSLYDVTWEFKDRDMFELSKGRDVLLVHTAGANTLTNAQKHSHCVIQGHHHSKFGIEYNTDTNMIRWAMTVGCLVDLHHPAFNYAAGATTNRPVIGCGAIIDNEPRLLPMNLLPNGRWDGVV